MHLSTATRLHGFERYSVVGDVSGSVAIALSAAQMIRAAGRTMIGGEIKPLSLRIQEARIEATRRLEQSAREKGANGIIRLRYHTAQIARSITEVIAYGTAINIDGYHEEERLFPKAVRKVTGVHIVAGVAALALMLILNLSWNILTLSSGIPQILGILSIGVAYTSFKRLPNAPVVAIWIGGLALLVSFLEMLSIDTVKGWEEGSLLGVFILPLTVEQAAYIKIALSGLLLPLGFAMKSIDMGWRHRVGAERRDATMKLRELRYDGCNLCGHTILDYATKQQMACILDLL